MVGEESGSGCENENGDEEAMRCDYRIIGGLVEAGNCVVCQAGTRRAGARWRVKGRLQGAGGKSRE